MSYPYINVIKKLVVSTLLLSGAGIAQAAPTTVIDVMGLYTKPVANHDPEARLASMVAFSNRVLSNSKADFRFRLVHVDELDIPSNQNVYSESLKQLKDSAEARALREKYGADMVTMITLSQARHSQGIGYSPTSTSTIRDNAYSLIAHICTLCLAHELGHNLGLGHSVNNPSAPKGFIHTYGRGHGVQNVFSTIMVYPEDFNAFQIPLFSNPNLNYKGLPLGVPAGQPNEADAVAAMHLVAPYVAALYPTKVLDSGVLMADAENLLVNGDMEIAFPLKAANPYEIIPWSKQGCDISYHRTAFLRTKISYTADSFEGASALKLTVHSPCYLANTTGSGRYDIWEPGRSYDFSAMMKLGSGPLAQAGVTVSLYQWEIKPTADITALTVDDYLNSQFVDFDLVADTIVNNQWTKVHGRITLPEDEPKMLLHRPLVIAVEGTQPYLLDNVRLVAIDDTTPDGFNFNSVTGAKLRTKVISNAITVSGINAETPIRMSSWGKYSINGGEFFRKRGMVSNGDSVRVHLYTGGRKGATRTATLIIGGVSASFSTTTTKAPPDKTPDNFSFNSVTGAELRTKVISNAITVSGINAEAVIRMKGRGTYSINGGKFTTKKGMVSNGDKVRVRLSTGPKWNATRTTTLSIGGVTATFSTTTKAPPDKTPDNFSFNSVTGAKLRTKVISNAITVSGINAQASIRMSSWGKYSINGGKFTRKRGMVSNGDSVRVRLNTGPKWNATRTATLKIGGVSAPFSITTQ
jgi:Metallo-peptidase family M12B Reprolysin-like